MIEIISRFTSTVIYKSETAETIREADNYKHQIQGCLYVTGRRWWDWLSYCPGMPPALVRFQRDDDYQKQLDVQLKRFLHQLDELGERLASLMPRAA